MDPAQVTSVDSEPRLQPALALSGLIEVEELSELQIKPMTDDLESTVVSDDLEKNGDIEDSKGKEKQGPVSSSLQEVASCSTTGAQSPEAQVTWEISEGVKSLEAGGSVDDVKGCPKLKTNPQHHDNYIAVDDFCLKHLETFPEDFRELIFDFVKNRLDLVVRVHGNFISQDRPEQALFAKYRGKFYPTVGSGIIGQIHGPYTQNDDDILCNRQKYYEHLEFCRSCTKDHSTGPVYCIPVHTAKHVIFDQSESSQSQIVLFDHHDDGAGSVSLSGGSFMIGETDDDYSWTWFFTHDTDLAQKFMDIITKGFKLGNVLEESLGDLEVRHGPIFLIGHPHGKKKYISIGRQIDDKDKFEFSSEPISFDAKSCSGMSGGLAWRLRDSNRSADTWGRVGTIRDFFPHSGVREDGTGVSGKGESW